MENEIMLEAHVQAGFVVGLPFSKPGGYDFRASNITQSISNLGATMLRHRLTPPPDEVYSLHRKLSGAFLACMKLGAVVPCRELLLQVYDHYHLGENRGKKLWSGSLSLGIVLKILINYLRFNNLGWIVQLFHCPVIAVGWLLFTPARVSHTQYLNQFWVDNYY